MEYKKAEEEYCNGLANKEDRDYVASTSDLAIMEQLRPDPKPMGGNRKPAKKRKKAKAKQPTDRTGAKHFRARAQNGPKHD